MAPADIDEYLAGLDEPARSTLQRLRETILAAAPEAEECISYGVPGFRVDGTVIAGFAAAQRHLSYFPHSGAVLDQLADALDGYDLSQGTLRFPPHQPLPDDLVERLIRTRLELT